MTFNTFISAMCCLSLAVPVFSLVSCDKKNVTNEVPETEVGPVDFFEGNPGRNRIELLWKVSDPKAKKAVVYWNNSGGSVAVPVQGITDTMSVIVTGLEEGNQSFSISLRDDAGSSSERSKIVARIYGDTYQQTLLPRPVQHAVFADGNVTISWGTPDRTALFTEVDYTEQSGAGRQVWAPSDTDHTILENYNPGSMFKHRTGYVPEPTAIDTFYSDYSEYGDIQYVGYTTTLAQRIVDNTNLIDTVYADTAFNVSTGVQVTEIYYANSQSEPMHVFILKADMTNPKITLEPTLANGDTDFSLQTVPEMVPYSDRAGHRVLAAVNADLFHVNEPWGVVVKNGTVLKNTWEEGAESTQSYLAVLSDGTPHIGDVPDFSSMEPGIRDALGGGWMLLKDNTLLSIGDVSVAPRTGAGISDSGFVYFIVADGRSQDYSNGLTLAQLGEMLKACGTTDAISLDGGGSSTFLIRDPDGNGWQVRNKPSDGSPRAVMNAWLIIADLP